MPTEIEIIRAALKASPEAHDRLRAMALEGKLGTYEEVPLDADLTVVCARDHFGIEGAKQALCECSAVVWLSPSTQAMLIARGAAPTATTRILCAECLHQEIKKSREESLAATRPN